MVLTQNLTTATSSLVTRPSRSGETDRLLGVFAKELTEAYAKTLNPLISSRVEVKRIRRLHLKMTEILFFET